MTANIIKGMGGNLLEGAPYVLGPANGVTVKMRKKKEPTSSVEET